MGERLSGGRATYGIPHSPALPQNREPGTSSVQHADRAVSFLSPALGERPGEGACRTNPISLTAPSASRPSGSTARHPPYRRPCFRVDVVLLDVDVTVLVVDEL